MLVEMNDTEIPLWILALALVAGTPVFAAGVCALLVIFL
jgi:hypothetical protein